MVRGHPDYGVSSSTSLIQQVPDPGEAAVRTHIINTHDRRGNIVWFDDFESETKNWQYTETGGGGIAAVIERTSDHTLYGSGAIRMSTVGSSFIAKRIPFTVEGRFGVEFAFSALTNDSDIEIDNSRLDLDFFVDNGAARRRFQLRVIMDDLASIIQVANNGTFTNIATAQQFVSMGSSTFFYRMWHFVKLVVDSTAVKYVRLIIDNVEYNLSSFSASVSDQTIQPKIEVNLGVTAVDGATLETYYFDNIIFTQNEP